jgi:hypothetical protein
MVVSVRSYKRSVQVEIHARLDRHLDPKTSCHRRLLAERLDEILQERAQAGGICGNPHLAVGLESEIRSELYFEARATMPESVQRAMRRPLREVAGSAFVVIMRFLSRLL